MSEVMYVLFSEPSTVIEALMGIFTTIEDAKAATDKTLFTEGQYIVDRGEWELVDNGKGEAWRREFISQPLVKRIECHWYISPFTIGTPYGVPSDWVVERD